MNDIFHHRREPFLAGPLEKYILNHNLFSEAIVCLLSYKLSGDIDQMSWLKQMEGFIDLPYEEDGCSVAATCLQDLQCIQQRDPACESLTHAFLNFKGFKALASHRLAHVLWRAGRKEVASAIQSRCSELFGVDIHPAARIGPGLMIDHATGVVIGETATVGANCSFLHGVTLGGVGSQAKGPRHPQIGNGVLIGCNASVLGNITVGDNAKIGAGSIVLKPVLANTTAVGNPAKMVGKNTGAISAAVSMDTALHEVITAEGRLYEKTWCACYVGSTAFDGRNLSILVFILFI